MKHPEQRAGEIYMGNSTEHQLLMCSWMSSRLGVTALDSSGNVIPDSPDSYGYGELRPWFIQCSEVEQAIVAEGLLNKPWSAEKIRDLTPMLSEDWNPCGSAQ